ncbi:cupin domain-containing protein [uncultured Pseudoteredinibacter sp.]|uniref:cupin domain-containing protein n=1 Tax=uncultured Pseudoteredinibacter sp. TaxID=1641701 RepID=UPI002615A4C1|nr:cupin domain-containing protein [uncultured Pseudoteredinibacter sp.]
MSNETDKSVSLDEKFALFDDHWSPKVIAQCNGQLVKLAKGKGELIWHKHDNEDELFFVHKGRLTLKFRDREIVLNPGELFVVPRGVEHCPLAEEETEILLFEPAGTAHTGEHNTEQTVASEDQPWI